MPDIRINNDLCVGCRACALVCPEVVFDLVGDYIAAAVAPEKCNACMACTQECPMDAISVK